MHRSQVNNRTSVHPSGGAQPCNTVLQSVPTCLQPTAADTDGLFSELGRVTSVHVQLSCKRIRSISPATHVPETFAQGHVCRYPSAGTQVFGAWVGVYGWESCADCLGVPLFFGFDHQRAEGHTYFGATLLQGLCIFLVAFPLSCGNREKGTTRSNWPVTESRRTSSQHLPHCMILCPDPNKTPLSHTVENRSARHFFTGLQSQLLIHMRTHSHIQHCVKVCLDLTMSTLAHYNSAFDGLHEIT